MAAFISKILIENMRYPFQLYGIKQYYKQQLHKIWTDNEKLVIVALSLNNISDDYAG